MSGNSDTITLRITENQCDLIQEGLQALAILSLQDLERIQDDDVFQTFQAEHNRLDNRISVLESLIVIGKELK